MAAASSLVRRCMRSESRRPPSYTRPCLAPTASASSSCSAASQPSTRCRASPPSTCSERSTRSATSWRPSGSPATATGCERTRPSPPSTGAPPSSPARGTDRLEATGTAIEPLPAVAPAIGDDVPVVVLPLLHGPHGEDGTVQGMLELAGVPVRRRRRARLRALHGQAQGQGRARRPRAPAGAVDRGARHRARRRRRPGRRRWPALPDLREAGQPRIVGRCRAGSLDEPALVEAAALAATYDEWIVVEEGAHGREIEVAVLGNASPRASVPGEIVPAHDFYDYEDKYVEDGAELRIPADLPDGVAEEIRRLARGGVHHPALRRHGPRRLLLRGGRPRHAPQRGQHDPRVHAHLEYPKLWEASGLPYDQLIDELVRLALERHEHRSRFSTKR